MNLTLQGLSYTRTSCWSPLEGSSSWQHCNVASQLDWERTGILQICDAQCQLQT